MYINIKVIDEIGIKQTFLTVRLDKSYSLVNGYVQNRQQKRFKVLFEITTILGSHNKRFY
ncbi:hypothetical protein SAMN06298216_4371 [Spirosomataceae bacterium TFI 002]|nr:hypothetical protein SAMN06298216_4371 [Spirosomataceae bacterium TFI 002]